LPLIQYSKVLKTALKMAEEYLGIFNGPLTMKIPLHDTREEFQYTKYKKSENETKNW
jgi:hypothetical protein